MDTFWRLRNAYHKAAEIKFAQDAYCAKVQSGVRMSDKETFPDDFGYEALIDVLRGRVKVGDALPPQQTRVNLRNG